MFLPRSLYIQVLYFYHSIMDNRLVQSVAHPRGKAVPYPSSFRSHSLLFAFSLSHLFAAAFGLLLDLASSLRLFWGWS